MLQIKSKNLNNNRIINSSISIKATNQKKKKREIKKRKKAKSNTHNIAISYTHISQTDEYLQQCYAIKKYLIHIFTPHLLPL